MELKTSEIMLGWISENFNTPEAYIIVDLYMAVDVIAWHSFHILMITNNAVAVYEYPTPDRFPTFYLADPRLFDKLHALVSKRISFAKEFICQKT